MIDRCYKELGIEAKEAKASLAELIVFETAHDAEITASWLGLEPRIWEAADGFLLNVNGYFLTTDWDMFKVARERIKIEYRLV